MRSAAFRATIGLTAWIALGVAALLLYRSELHLGSLSTSQHTFDYRAREAAAALVDARVAQQAYVAQGQGIAFWMPKVTASADAARSALSDLREAAGPAAQAALQQASSSTAEFESIDKRARDYLKSGQTLMAGDVIFTEGSEAARTAAQQIEEARQAERQTFEANVALVRKQEAMIVAAAAAVTGLAVLLLAPGGRVRVEEAVTESLAHAAAPSKPAAAPAPAGPEPAAPNSTLVAAATLATEFGRVRDLEELKRTLGHAADAMDASGVMVWMGSPASSDLRVVLAHGYTSDVLARMPAVPRSADNAAAAAYRSGTLQIVLRRPGASTGAVVAPIVAADGCIGALSAEIRHGAETSEAVQALAEIAAAHLAGVLASAPAQMSEPRAAAQA